MAVVLSVLALCVGFIALVLSWLALVHPGSVRRRLRRRGRVLEIPAEVEALRDEVEVLRADAAETMRHAATTPSATWVGTCPGRWHCSTTAATESC
jgi:type II secretory pathway component PulM